MKFMVCLVCLCGTFALVEPKIIHRSPSSGSSSATTAKRFRNDFPVDTPPEPKKEQVFQDEVRPPVVRNSDPNQIPSFHEKKAHFAPESLKEKLEMNKVTKTPGSTTRREPFFFKDEKELFTLIDKAYDKAIIIARSQTNDKITMLTNFQLKDFVKHVLNPENSPLSDAETTALDAAANQYIRRQGMSPGANGNQIPVSRNFVRSYSSVGWFRDRAPELTKVRQEEYERRIREEAERLIRLQEKEFNDNNNAEQSNDFAPESEFTTADYTNNVIDSTFNPLTGLYETTINNDGEGTTINTMDTNDGNTAPSSTEGTGDMVSNDSPVMTEAEQLVVEAQMRMLRERDPTLTEEHTVGSRDTAEIIPSSSSEEIVTDDNVPVSTDTNTSTVDDTLLSSDTGSNEGNFESSSVPSKATRNDNQYDNIVEDSLGI